MRRESPGSYSAWLALAAAVVSVVVVAGACTPLAGSGGATQTDGGTAGAGGLFGRSTGGKGSGGGLGAGGLGSGGVGAAGGAGGTGGKGGTGGAATGGAGTGGVATGGGSGNGGAAACAESDTRCSGTSAMQTCVSRQWATAMPCPTRQSCPASGKSCVCTADAVCTAVGPTCAMGSGAVVNCKQDANACFYQESSTPCGSHQACTGAAGAGRCACGTDPACAAAGISCSLSSSSILVTCAQDAQGCIYSSSSMACAAPLVCERSAPAVCADSRFAAWPLPPDLDPSDYKDNGDATITDNVTGLMWQADTSSSHMTWDAAKEYCPAATTGKHSDWRLPTRIELLSLVDYGRHGPAVAFIFNTMTGHWSSSSYAGSSFRAWYVSFGEGYSSSFDKTMMLDVVCVR